MDSPLPGQMTKVGFSRSFGLDLAGHTAHQPAAQPRTATGSDEDQVYPVRLGEANDGQAGLALDHSWFHIEVPALDSGRKPLQVVPGMVQYLFLCPLDVFLPQYAGLGKRLHHSQQDQCCPKALGLGDGIGQGQFGQGRAIKADQWMNSQ